MTHSTLLCSAVLLLAFAAATFGESAAPHSVQVHSADQQLVLQASTAIHVPSEAEAHHDGVSEHQEEVTTAGTTKRSSAAVRKAMATGDLHCYQCNSLEDAGCENGKTVKARYLKKCEPSSTGQVPTGCWNLQQTVDYDQSEDLVAHNRVVRKCAYHKQDSTCVFRSGFGALVNHCFCNTTACNTAYNTMQANPLMSLLSTVLLVVIGRLAFY